MAFKKMGPVRYPYSGDLYSAEGQHRIRVERDGKSGYFDDRANWLEGEVRNAEPCMCRFMSSAWVIDQAPGRYGLASSTPSPAVRSAPNLKKAARGPKMKARKQVRKVAKKTSRGRSK